MSKGVIGLIEVPLSPVPRPLDQFSNFAGKVYLVP